MIRGALIVLTALFWMSATAFAADHLYLSCADGQTTSTRELPGGRVIQTERDDKEPIAIDVDFKRKTVNKYYRLSSAKDDATITGEEQSYDGIDLSISIDRLNGTAEVKGGYISVGCEGGKKECERVTYTTRYKCAKASPKF